MMHFRFIAAMNKRVPWWSIGSSLILLAMLGGGCLKSGPPEKGTEASSESPLAFQPVPEPDEMTEASEETDDSNISEGEVRFASTETPLPDNINPTPALAEVIRFTESGVDESVMLAYITNSENSFNLGADEIIYLNDIGIPAPIVRAMLQHDIALKKTAAGFAQDTGPGGKEAEPIGTSAPEVVNIPSPGAIPTDYPGEVVP